MKKEIIIPALLSLIIGYSGGYLTPKTSTSRTESTQPNTHTHEEDTEHEGETSTSAHSHETFEVPAENAPTVELIVEEDQKSGYNITLKTTNFTFTPEQVNGVNRTGEGHAHLYIDNEKVARIYGPNYHLDENFDGTKTFKVTLNANDHKDYSVDGKIVASEKVVNHEHHE